ncbi:MAG: AMP-binding protein, partial [Desulfarculaceae bacterium]|nr:AMP-binding protein [Desulfarculaceae bacterium]
NNSQTRLLIIESEFIGVIHPVAEEVSSVGEMILVGDPEDPRSGPFEDLIEEGSPQRPPVYVDDEDEAFIVYTAGTTGKPKGALLTHKNLISNSLDIIHENNQSQPRHPDLPLLEPKILTVAPLFHVAGLINIIRTMMERKTIVLKDFDPVEILKTIEAEKITYIFLVPTMWRILLGHPQFADYDVSSIRVAGFGADVIENALKQRILEHFPNASLFEAFGQTEMSATTTFMKHQDTLRKEGSVGLPLRMVSLRLVDFQMRDVAVGEVGEVVYQGPGMFKGYYNDPEETAKAFEGGWFHSGDLARRDEDGFLTIVDRKKDMILSGGENIYCAEIEQALLKHPEVLEAAVIGVPDPKWGQSVKAYVVVSPDSAASPEALIDFCTQHLARFKRPKQVEFMDALPRSATGKILKKVLREKEEASQ